MDYKSPEKREISLLPQTSTGSNACSPVAPNPSRLTPSPIAFSSADSKIYEPWTTDLQPLVGSAPTQATRNMSRQTDRVPEISAHLTSMESSTGEATSLSTAASPPMSVNSPKPELHVDTNTYSYTYHGRAQRFSTH